MKESPEILLPFEIAKDFVIRKFKGPEARLYREHLLMTATWIKRLDPTAGEALLTAAILHDIERAFHPPDPERFKNKSNMLLDPRYLAWHQNRSAEIAAAILREKNLNEPFVERVHELILHHEDGGDEEQNLLKDADSLSFFETSVKHFLEVWVPIVGKEKVKEKFDWMYGRISSLRAKQFGKSLYTSAIKKLESLDITSKS